MIVPLLAIASSVLPPPATVTVVLLSVMSSSARMVRLPLPTVIGALMITSPAVPGLPSTAFRSRLPLASVPVEAVMLPLTVSAPPSVCTTICPSLPAMVIPPELPARIVSAEFSVMNSPPLVVLDATRPAIWVRIGLAAVPMPEPAERVTVPVSALPLPPRLN